MTIVAARIDERMIHGQVATVWTNTVGADRIMVVNDAAVHDDMQIAGLKMARPAGKKLAVSSVEKAIINLKPGAKYDSEKVFVITRNVADMAALIDGGVPLPIFNIGNISEKPGSKRIKASVNLTDEDIATIRRLIQNGTKITAQMLPNESDASVETFLTNQNE